MQHLRRALLSAALLAICAVPALAARDANALFRSDMIDAQVKLGWKGPQLDDDTRFTVAAAGLSWQPAWEGAPLLTRGKRATIYAPAAERKRAFLAVSKSAEDRVAFAYAFSLVLAPPEGDAPAWQTAFDYLRDYETGFDRALIGVLQAPDKLPLLPAYRYAAADALVYRASVRLLPLYLTLAGTDDTYLRSRAIAALGLVGFRSRRQGDGRIAGLYPPVREASISAVQQRMMAEALRQAANDRSYRVRAAAALALGLMGGEDDPQTLDKLAKDRAYLLLPAEGKDTKRVIYPVRVQAVAALARLGGPAREDGCGTFSGKELRQATRGGQNVTNDRSGLRRDQFPGIRFCDGEW